jgi:hypothetical protein
MPMFFAAVNKYGVLMETVIVLREVGKISTCFVAPICVWNEEAFFRLIIQRIDVWGTPADDGEYLVRIHALNDDSWEKYYYFSQYEKTQSTDSSIVFATTRATSLGSVWWASPVSRW